MTIAPPALLKKIRKQLKENIDPEYKKNANRFHREKVRYIGVRAPIVRKIAKNAFNEIRSLSKKEIFALSEELLQSGAIEEATIGIQWVSSLQKEYTPEDFALFASYLAKYIRNWASDDDFCMHVLSPLVLKFPQLIPSLHALTASKNLWVRRASAVSLITSSKNFEPKNLPHIFKTAKILLRDPEDMVQKGYGWMLKEASNHHPREVFDFVMLNKKQMPRTALRYAIEKLPQHLRKEALKTP